MTTGKLALLSAEDLLAEFIRIAAAQDAAELDSNTRRMNRLFWEMEGVEAELKSRPGDQRSVLASLYEHPSPQVRLKAALATLGIEPERAMAVLQRIRLAGHQPQALEAGMALYNIDTGIFKPS